LPELSPLDFFFPQNKNEVKIKTILNGTGHHYERDRLTESHSTKVLGMALPEVEETME
jgi:hypothetical protein